MPIIEIARIQVRRGLENTTGIPQLAAGEFGWAEDTQHLYIGKRIVEGANSDDNTRILTEFDLRSISDILSNASTATVNTPYQYRGGVSYISTWTSVRSVQAKLDDTVSLCDFGVLTTSTAVDIAHNIKSAVKAIFDNPSSKDDARRALKIPAGNYIISQMVDLPPRTVLIGEGRGITNLIMSPQNADSMFRTVDGLGHAFSDNNMQSGSTSSREILISDMSLSYSSGNSNNNPLISLDNTQNARVTNVGFNTVNADYMNPISTGTALAIRGNIGSDESTFLCRNIVITNCLFENVNRPIDIYGKVTGPVIENNVFGNLTQGIHISAISTATSPPVNTSIRNNKFKFIFNDAIHVDTSTFNTNLISSNNAYHYVGNHSFAADDNLNAPATAVLTFNAPGNTSVNDFFNRKVTKDSTDGTDYYNPLVNSNARINNATVYTKSLIHATDGSQLNQNVVRIPLTGSDQVGYIDYQLSNVDMSRKGRLTLNISSDGFASVSDYYNYSEVLADSSLLVLFSTDLSNSPYSSGTNNFVTVTCSNNSTATTHLEYSLDLMV